MKAIPVVVSYEWKVVSLSGRFASFKIFKFKFQIDGLKLNFAQHCRKFHWRTDEISEARMTTKLPFAGKLSIPMESFPHSRNSFSSQHFSLQIFFTNLTSRLSLDIEFHAILDELNELYANFRCVFDTFNILNYTNTDISPNLRFNSTGMMQQFLQISSH